MGSLVYFPLKRGSDEIDSEVPGCAGSTYCGTQMLTGIRELQKKPTVYETHRYEAGYV